MITSPTGDVSVDNELKQICAFSFPAVLSVVGAKKWPDIRNVYHSLAQSRNANIKKTLAYSLHEVARLLGYHYLDSGSLYRVTGLAMRRAGLSADAAHEARIAALAAALPLQFVEGKVLLDGEDVSEDIRSEAAGMDASRVSTLPAV
eukprot:gene5676-6765_t